MRAVVTALWAVSQEGQLKQTGHRPVATEFPHHFRVGHQQ